MAKVTFMDDPTGKGLLPTAGLGIVEPRKSLPMSLFVLNALFSDLASSPSPMQRLSFTARLRT